MSEIYGKKRADFMVVVGFLMSLLMLALVQLAMRVPPHMYWVPMEGAYFDSVEGYQHAFESVFALNGVLLFGSMTAYLCAQLTDNYLYHFWKRLTDGKHLWLRNNGSTLVSQLVDTVAVILITHFLAKGLPIEQSEPLWPQLLTFIGAGYTFKLTVALVDTVPFYWGAKRLGRYLRIHPVHGTENPGVEP